MTRAGALLAILGLDLALGGCASTPTRPACPAGQAQLRTAQLFLGVRPTARLNDRDLSRFVDQEVTPRFPDGVTVVDGGGQWKGDDNRMIREAAKVVLIVLPQRGDPAAKVEAVRTAYHTRFNQETMLVMPPASCVAL